MRVFGVFLSDAVFWIESIQTTVLRSCYIFLISKLSKTFCFPEELAVVPWGKVRDGARALCRCNLQFDLGCMHSFPCASLALSGRQWSVSTLVFYGGRSWYFPFPLHSNSIFQGSDLCHSIGLGIRLRLTCWWPMLLSCFLICTLPAVTFLWGEWGCGKKVFFCFSGNHVTPKIIYDSAESLCKRYLCLHNPWHHPQGDLSLRSLEDLAMGSKVLLQQWWSRWVWKCCNLGINELSYCIVLFVPEIYR